VNSSRVTWFSNAILYHIFIDRFGGYDQNKNWKKPQFIGGNLKGIMDKKDYLSELGVNTLWISPFLKTDAYHGYHITDFFKPDPHFGTMEDVRCLLEVFHRKNIRIILDFVPNHCSVNHPYFQAALKERASKYQKWFYMKPLSKKYTTFLHFNELPKFNLNNPETRSYIIDAAKYWLSMGFDGIRLDHAIGPSHEFWKIFCSEIKRLNPEAVLIGEAWLDGIGFRYLKTLGIRRKYIRWITGIHPQDIQLEYRNEFDGVLDFYFRHRITEFIAWKENHKLYLDMLRRSMDKHYAKFPAGYYLPTFIDNHDMNRFIYDAGQNKEKLKDALAFQFSLPQPPIIYYGTETGLTHTDPVQGHVPFSDLQVRQPMPWHKPDNEMIDFVKELIILRKKRYN
jgi:cyclomaltodextrinase